MKITKKQLIELFKSACNLGFARDDIPVKLPNSSAFEKNINNLFPTYAGINKQTNINVQDGNAIKFQDHPPIYLFSAEVEYFKRYKQFMGFGNRKACKQIMKNIVGEHDTFEQEWSFQWYEVVKQKWFLAYGLVVVEISKKENKDLYDYMVKAITSKHEEKAIVKLNAFKDNENNTEH